MSEYFLRPMSRISIDGETKYPKDQISNQIDKLVKERLHNLKNEIEKVNDDLEFFRRKFKLSD